MAQPHPLRNAGLALALDVDEDEAELAGLLVEHQADLKLVELRVLQATEVCSAALQGLLEHPSRAVVAQRLLGVVPLKEHSAVGELTEHDVARDPPALLTTLQLRLVRPEYLGHSLERPVRQANHLLSAKLTDLMSTIVIPYSLWYIK